MSFWNIFKDFVTTDGGQVINKVGDDTWLDHSGAVFRKQGDVVTTGPWTDAWPVKSSERW